MAATLASCSLPPPDDPPSRYELDQDTAPLKPMVAADVADAIPRPDPLLAVGNQSPYEVNGETYQIMEDYVGYREQGVASWYGSKFHGYATSNGETYDLYTATAAHKTLPIPIYARVTNLDNGRSVVVRINDRGPFHSDRLIDLSYAAAVKLGYMEQGTAPVEVQVIEVQGVDDRRGASYGVYRYLQLGAFGTETSARRLQAELSAVLSAPVSISEVEADGSLLYRVRVGPVDNSDHLLSLQRTLQERGYPVGQPLP
ncbi:MAG: septal ring lytic transglycosylase RlpA family protein [Pseudomonadota bacterium]